MNNLAGKSLRLLLRPPESSDIIKKDLYLPCPLSEDIRRCSSDIHEISDRDIINILIKYFHAYVHPESLERGLSLKEITTCFNRFIHRRVGSELLWDRLDLRKELLKFGFALAMLADLPKSAHIFREIAGQTFNPLDFEHTYVGLDIGAGTGILMLAQWISARRNRFTRIEITGIEREPNTFERTRLTVKKLGIGTVIQNDAKKKTAYSFLADRPATFITNETLPGASARLWKEDFIRINQTLFDNYAHLLKKTRFFPNRVTASDKSGKHTITLSRENCFHRVKDGPPLRLLYPRAIELDGTDCPLTMIGNSFDSYLEDPWPDILSSRW